MTKAEQHRYQLLQLVYACPNGIRTATIYEKTGMSPYDLTKAAQAEDEKVKKYFSKGFWGYRRKLQADTVVTENVAPARERVAIKDMPIYMGENKRAGAVG